MENISKYCYDNGVLINKFDIHDLDVLHKAERDITTYRISQLECGENLFTDYFNVDNYLKIHEFLFSDIYDFAGKIRDEAIYKTNLPFDSGKTPFCYPSFIYFNLDSILKEMKENVRKIKSRELLLKYISYYYGEINMIHPFREGNGRVLRTYMEMLVDYFDGCLSIPNMEICYSLWSVDDRNELLRATIINSKTGSFQEIMNCFDKVLVNKQKKKKLN